MVLFASDQWMAAKLAVFTRVNNAICVGQLSLRVGTTEVFMYGVRERYYLGWKLSLSESSSVIE